MQVSYTDIFLGGFSQGGCLSLHLLREEHSSRLPNQTRGIFSLGSFLINDSIVLAEQRVSTSRSQSDLPVLMMHGTSRSSLIYSPILSHPSLSYLTPSYRILSCPIPSSYIHPILSYLLPSHHILSQSHLFPYPILSFPILSHPIPSYPIPEYPILSSPVPYYPILSHLTLSHPILTHLVLSHLILSHPIPHYPIPSHSAPVSLTPYQNCLYNSQYFFA